MIELDQETWIYLAIIAVFIVYFMWNSRRAKQNRKARRNRSFRKRYLERKKKENMASEASRKKD